MGDIGYPQVTLWWIWKEGPQWTPVLAAIWRRTQYIRRMRSVLGPTIPRQDIKTSFPVQVIVGLAQVKEDGVDGCIRHGKELLKQFFLEGGGPCSSLRAIFLQSVMELDGRQYSEIDDARY